MRKSQTNGKSPAKRPTKPKPQPAATFAPAPTHDDIAYRAYELFLQRGAQHGQDFEDWLAAERELQTL
jgi:hypothetical protein